MVINIILLIHGVQYAHRRGECNQRTDKAAPQGAPFVSVVGLAMASFPPIRSKSLQTLLEQQLSETRKDTKRL